MKRIRKRDFDSVTGKKYDGMMGRCYRPSDRSYTDYGLRGIKVCGQWIRDISLFRAWIGQELVRLGITEKEFIEGATRLYTLDRIESDGHYSPENCRLVSSQAQGRNQRRREKRVYVSAEGDEIVA